MLHLHQHQSSHGDHLVDGIGGTPWWCDLLSAGLLRSHRLDFWIGLISIYQHWSAQHQCIAYWVWPRLATEGLVLGCSLMVRWYIHAACWWMVAIPLTERNLDFFTRTSGKAAKLFTRKTLSGVSSMKPVRTFVTSACWLHRIVSSFVVYCMAEISCKQLCWFPGCSPSKKKSFHWAVGGIWN